jgi:hypothetical protein
MKHAATRELYRYWNLLRGARIAPDRVDIDPAAIRRILGDTFILEADQVPLFPYRLAGTRLCAVMGHELRGTSFLDGWAGADRDEVMRLLEAVVRDGAAVVVGVDATASQGQALELELLLLPLRHRGSMHSRILGSLTPADMPHWVGICPLVRLSVHSVRILSPAERALVADEEGDEEGAARPPAGPTSHGRRVDHLTVLDGGKA